MHDEGEKSAIGVNRFKLLGVMLEKLATGENAFASSDVIVHVCKVVQTQ